MMNGGVIIGAGVAQRAMNFSKKIVNEFGRGGGKIHYGERLTDIVVQGEQVFLSFLGHAKPLVHSYVIAADGMGSLVRSKIFPGSRVSHQGLRTWLGECVTPVAASFVGTTTEAWGNGANELAPRLDHT
jgi:2-polyprenyl-6-methoxyphenol hydroxylase-like FAD-dependent oxidoreductase